MSVGQMLVRGLRSATRRHRLLASCLLIIMMNMMLLTPTEKCSVSSRRPAQLPSRRQRLTSCSGPQLSSWVEFDTEGIRPQLDSSPNAIEADQFWSDRMEAHYQEVRSDPGFPLKILLVPHGPVGPDGCPALSRLRRGTLEALATVLPKLRGMTFTWTGVSELQHWWSNASEASRQAIADLVRSGRLEVTAGGWAAPPESTSRLQTLVHQLTEEDQWLRQHVGVTPETALSADPSGPGSTLPYLLSQVGVRQIIAMNVSGAWVDYLAVRRGIDFQWRQQWDEEGTETLLTHLQPQDGLPCRNDCGTVEGSSPPCPSGDLCHGLLRRSGYHQMYAGVSNDTIERRVEALVAAAGRVASFSSHNVALVMVATDFKPENASAWGERHSSLQQLVRYINDNQLNAAAEIATPADYFRAVRERAAGAPLAQLTGDLHAAADDDLFTGQPRWQRAARQLEARLRAASLLLVWALGVHQRNPPSDTSRLLVEGFRRLTATRRAVALLSRRGAAAGAVSPALAGQLATTDRVLTSITSVLLSAVLLELGRFATPREAVRQYVSLRHGLGTAPQFLTVTVRAGAAHRLVVQNALSFERSEVVQFLTRTPNIAVQNVHGEDVRLEFTAHEDMFKAKFIAARLPPVSMTTYHVVSTDLGSSADPTLVLDQDEVGLVESVAISNARFTVTADRSGVAWTIHDHRHGDEIPLEIGFVPLEPSDRSEEQGNELLSCPERRWAQHEDSITSQAVLSCGRLRLTLSLTRAPDAVGQALRLLVQAEPASLHWNETAAPLLLRLRTTLRSSDDAGGLFTDSGDYQMVRRSAAPLPGGLRPATSQASLQDGRLRISLLMDQPRGVASPAEGELAAVLHPGGDDTDPVYAEFLLVFERTPERPAGAERELFANSPLVALLSRQLNNPVLALFDRQRGAVRVRATPQLLSAPLPCDCELVALRQLEVPGGDRPAARALLTLQRRRLDCRLWDERDELGCRLEERLPALSPLLGVESLRAATLTGAEEPSAPPLAGLEEVQLPTDRVRSYIITLDRQLAVLEPKDTAGQKAQKKRKKSGPLRSDTTLHRDKMRFEIGKSYQLQL